MAVEAITNYEAENLIEKKTSHNVLDIRRRQDGCDHFDFDVELEDRVVIARISKPTQIIEDKDKRDFHFNSPLSRKREAWLSDFAREKGLPVPRIELFGDEPDFVLVDKPEGMLWSEYIEKNNFSKQAYLQSMKHLGELYAKAQQITFDSFGSVMADGKIEPKAKDLAERLSQISRFQLDRAEKTGVIDSEEYGEIHRFYTSIIREISETIGYKQLTPVLAMGVLHPMNVYVDEHGKPTGVYCLESCQAGHPEFDLYNVDLQFFSYFNPKVFREAEQRFFETFENAGGQYNRSDEVNQLIRLFFCVNHTLGSVVAYNGAKDVLRDSWSVRFKEILFRTIQNREMDYEGFANIIREKTQQPAEPTLP